MNYSTKIKLNLIDNFKNHPFKVENDDSLKELAKSIKQNGLLNPVIVRKKGASRYEMISGHRRKTAMELLGIEEVDAIVKEHTDDEAVIYMVDSNIYREKILPSEKAFAYKMKMNAIKHQGKNTSDTGSPKLSSEIVGTLICLIVLKITNTTDNYMNIFIGFSIIISLLSGSIIMPCNFILPEEQSIIGTILAYSLTSGILALSIFGLNQIFNVRENMNMTLVICRIISAVIYIISWIVSSQKIKNFN